MNHFYLQSCLALQFGNRVCKGMALGKFGEAEATRRTFRLDRSQTIILRWQLLLPTKRRIPADIGNLPGFGRHSNQFCKSFVLRSWLLTDRPGNLALTWSG